MAKNDVVLIDSILDQRATELLPSSDLGEVFEYFALEQVMKDFDLSKDELEFGWIDGSNDGGIDAFFVLLNGLLVQDTGTFAWPKTRAQLDVWIFTCKRHDTFEQAPINSLLASAQELFDLSLTRDQLNGKYSDEVLRARELLSFAYKKVSAAMPEIVFRFFYVSRGDSGSVADNVSARARQLENLVGSFFSSTTVRFEFKGATELVELFRRTKQFSLNLPFIEHVSAGGGSYVLLARLDDYKTFVSDESGSLRRYLFDSNVRDYLRGTRVNEDISESLRTHSAPDFWWLNNGITILATNAALSGKTISLQNIQIVNGLQTTESIYAHFQLKKGVQTDPRTLLIKVLVSTDTLVRDRIIRATNNQNAVELSSLHATDKIQRDIEEILEQHEWYYERRKNYYRNIGKPPQRFVLPLYLVACVIALIFKNPASAAKVRNRLMRNPASYSSVFSDDFPLQVWPVIVSVTKKVEEELNRLRPESGELAIHFQARWRGLISLICAARILGTFDYSISDLVQLDVNAITSTMISEVWRLIQAASKPKIGRAFRNPQFALDRCTEAASMFGLAGLQSVGKRNVVKATEHLAEAFITAVAQVLSTIPAGSDSAALIAKHLGCKRAKVKSAIYTLKRRGTAN